MKSLESIHIFGVLLLVLLAGVQGAPWGSSGPGTNGSLCFVYTMESEPNESGPDILPPTNRRQGGEKKDDKDGDGGSGSKDGDKKNSRSWIPEGSIHAVTWSLLTDGIYLVASTNSGTQPFLHFTTSKYMLPSAPNEPQELLELEVVTNLGVTVIEYPSVTHDTVFYQDGPRIMMYDTLYDTVKHMAGPTTIHDFGFADGTGLEVRIQKRLFFAATPTTLYMSDELNHCIRSIDLTGAATKPALSFTVTAISGECTVPGVGKTGSLHSQLYRRPGPLAIDPTDESLYIADNGNRHLRVINNRTQMRTVLSKSDLLPLYDLRFLPQFDGSFVGFGIGESLHCSVMVMRANPFARNETAVWFLDPPSNVEHNMCRGYVPRGVVPGFNRSVLLVTNHTGGNMGTVDDGNTTTTFDPRVMSFGDYCPALQDAYDGEGAGSGGNPPQPPHEDDFDSEVSVTIIIILVLIVIVIGILLCCFYRKIQHQKKMLAEVEAANQSKDKRDMGDEEMSSVTPRAVTIADGDEQDTVNANMGSERFGRIEDFDEFVSLRKAILKDPAMKIVGLTASAYEQRGTEEPNSSDDEVATNPLTSQGTPDPGISTSHSQDATAQNSIGSHAAENPPTEGALEMDMVTLGSMLSLNSVGVNIVEKRGDWIRDMIIHGTVQRGPLLGRGGYGQVYVGLLQDQKTTVAIKEMQAHQTEVVSSVKQEVVLLSTIMHPNIVAYYFSSFDPRAGLIRIFMEHLEGGTLIAHAKKQQMTEVECQDRVREIVHALAFVHSRGVAHRDVKGENVLLDNSGQCKLADFGCAKQVQQTMQGPDQASMAVTAVGTPAFMAPEVLLADSENSYGRKADIWGVGILTLQLLNKGQLPWPANKLAIPAALMVHIANPNTLPDMPSGISPGARSFVERCCSREPSSRASAAQLLRHEWLLQPSQ